MPVATASSAGTTSLDAATFDAAAPWRLAPSVALRPEPFGALAYDFTTRTLSFLKSTLLVRVVIRLERAGSALAAIDGVGIDAAERAPYISALAALARTGILIRRDLEVAP